MFIETPDESNFSFSTNIKVTNNNFINNLPIDRDPSFNNVHHLLQPFTEGAFPNALGEMNFKIKISTSADFKSLTPDMLDNIYLLIHLSS